MRSKGVFLAVILTTVLCISGNLLAYSGGNGTTGNPYQIANVADFNQLSATPADCNKSFILTANLNFGGLSLTPVGNISTQFTGVFNGNDNIISNAVINQPGSSCIGLFGYVGTVGKIRNLGVENVNITGQTTVGGLVGFNSGILTSCYATGSVTGNACVGGLVGYNYLGILTSCYVTGSVTGTYNVGGLVGYNTYGTLTGCYATGSVTGTSDGVGGLVGLNYNSTLTGCYMTGSVSGNSYVGGLVGYNSVYITTGTITSCYSTGAVSGSAEFGGLVGRNDAPDDAVTACFWDIQTSGTNDGVGNVNPDPSGVMGLDTATMMTLSTFTSAGWDFSTTDGDPADWMMLRPGQDYPRLAWQEIFAGDIAGLYGVNFVDYAEMAAHWGQTGCPTGCENADINTDGTVDIYDLELLADNWLVGI